MICSTIDLCLLHMSGHVRVGWWGLVGSGRWVYWSDNDIKGGRGEGGTNSKLSSADKVRGLKIYFE